MNGNISGTGPRARSWPWRPRIHAAAVVGIVLLAVACGGCGGSPSVGGSTTYQKALAYSQCMRSHGVPNFPDPGSNGTFGSPGQRGTINLGNTAVSACRHLLPNHGVVTPAQKQQMVNQALKFTQCMRSHGVPNFPDPSTAGGGISFQMPGNPHSPQTQSAQHACQKYMFGPGKGPIGLP